jgi:hypothetical protein
VIAGADTVMHPAIIPLQITKISYLDYGLNA